MSSDPVTSAFVTVENLATGKTLSYNISGPGTQTVYPDGTIKFDVGGPNLFWTTRANSFPGVPQLSYTTGHLTLTVAPDGTTPEYNLSGRRTDVCAALAA